MICQPCSSPDEQSRNSSLPRVYHPLSSPHGSQGTLLVFWSLLPSQSCFSSHCRNRTGAEESRRGLQVQRHSHKDLGRRTAVSILAPCLCRCLFSFGELKGQNFKHILPSDTRLSRLSPDQPNVSLGHFNPLWMTVGVGRD